MYNKKARRRKRVSSYPNFLDILQINGEKIMAGNLIQSKVLFKYIYIKEGEKKKKESKPCTMKEDAFTIRRVITVYKPGIINVLSCLKLLTYRKYKLDTVFSNQIYLNSTSCAVHTKPTLKDIAP